MEQNHCFIQFCLTNVTIEQIFSHFYSVILYLKDIGVLINLKFWVLRVPPIQISSQNGKIQVLFNKFSRRINLMALLLTILGSRNKKMNSKFWNLAYLGYLPYKFRLRRVQTCVLLRKFHPKTNLTALLVTLMGSRNKKKH
jgi:hypothetical protein